MSFPEKGWFFFPRGWQDLGKVRKTHSIVGGETVTSTPIHGLCGTRLHVGREENKPLPFRFCPRCMMKLSTSNDV